MDIKKILGEMTLEDKVRIVAGETFWTTFAFEKLGIPAIFVSDGPHGLRKQELSNTSQEDIYKSIDAVCYPTACASAASFNKQMLREVGSALGKECQAENVAVLLGPGINIKRSPLCGRNFEYFSEDPYVAGEMSAAFIQGVQSEGVGTSLKHFAANNQETERMYSSSNADERTLREIYLAGFETAVKKAAPWTLMASYNRINGTYSSENKWLLTDVLRDEWGFKGLVMSDWGAVSDRIKGIAAGLDLEMPGSGSVNEGLIADAVKSGKLAEADLDKAVENILDLIDKSVKNHREEIFDREKDHEHATRAAEECIVLLKNSEVSGSEKVLPLKKTDKIALIGGFAENPRFQGGGSSHINAHKIVSAVSVMADYGDITYSEGFPFDSDEADEAKMNQAVETAKSADKIVVFAGLPDSYESEGYDRTHLRLPQCQNDLIDRLLELGKPVTVVLHNGAPVELPWVDKVDAIVEAYLAGEGVGEAVMNILYGRVNPSGKLAETFPIKLEDNPSYLTFPGKSHTAEYKEGVFVGYRYYDTKKQDVLFPFGFGLSYTSFEYSDLKIEGDSVDGPVKVTVKVTNTGKVAGKETVQLYVADKTDVIERPVHELKGFEKISLDPGESKTVSFELGRRSFAWFNTAVGDWYAAEGEYVIEIAASSRDIRLSQAVQLKGDAPVAPVIDMDVQLGDLLKYEPAKKVLWDLLKEEIGKFTGSKDTFDHLDPMTYAMLQYMPIRALRSFTFMSNEKMNEVVEALKKVTK